MGLKDSDLRIAREMKYTRKRTGSRISRRRNSIYAGGYRRMAVSYECEHCNPHTVPPSGGQCFFQTKGGRALRETTILGAKAKGAWRDCKLRIGVRERAGEDEALRRTCLLTKRHGVLKQYPNSKAPSHHHCTVSNEFRLPMHKLLGALSSSAPADSGYTCLDSADGLTLGLTAVSPERLGRIKSGERGNNENIPSAVRPSFRPWQRIY